MITHQAFYIKYLWFFTTVGNANLHFYYILSSFFNRKNCNNSTHGFMFTTTPFHIQLNDKVLIHLKIPIFT